MSRAFVREPDGEDESLTISALRSWGHMTDAQNSRLEAMASSGTPSSLSLWVSKVTSILGG